MLCNVLVDLVKGQDLFQNFTPKYFDVKFEGMILTCDLHPKKIREIFLVYFEMLYVVGDYMVTYKFCMVPTNLVRCILVVLEGSFILSSIRQFSFSIPT
jgi:hypothetical protein